MKFNQLTKKMKKNNINICICEKFVIPLHRQQKKNNHLNTKL